MSKAKLQAQQQQGNTPPPYPYPYPPPSSGSFAWGFLLGQLTLAAILFTFTKFFIFGEAPSADERASARAAARRQRTLSHTRQRTLSTILHSNPAPAVLKPRTDAGLTVQKILEKTYYHVVGHQPESLDWFNVLIAQTIAQLRADAHEDDGMLNSLTEIMNGGSKPSWMDEIRVTEISLGEEFPIFSNCRVIPVDEHGVPIRELTGNRGERLQARMDVDLSDVLTLGVETKLVLNYPKPFVLVLPVALAVSVVRFSGTLSLSFSPSSSQPASGDESSSGHSPTTLTFTFLDDYRLDLSIRSLIGSRSRLQDVPKIAQIIEARIHQWFDDRCVEPRFQQIVLPSLWPRMKNTRGGDGRAEGADGSTAGGGAGTVNDEEAIGSSSPSTHALHPPNLLPSAMKLDAEQIGTTARDALAATAENHGAVSGDGAGALGTAEQRTRDWAATHATVGAVKSRPKRDESSEIELAGQEMREAEDRARRRELARVRHEQDRTELRRRTGREGYN